MGAKAFRGIGKRIYSGQPLLRLHFLCFYTKKAKIFKKLYIFPLSFQTIPLPLHSKLKNESLKFFKYVTENQNKITVLRS